MKLALISTILFFLGGVAAQAIHILSPIAGQNITISKKFTVQVWQPSSLSSLQEFSIAIGIRKCLQDPCDDSDTALGTILHSGKFTPSYQSIYGGGEKYYQNFTVKIANTEGGGLSALSVAHFYAIGAGNIPELDVANVTINVAS